MEIWLNRMFDSARMMYMTGLNICLAFSFITRFLKKRRSYGLLILYLVSKLLIYNWLFLQIIGTSGFADQKMELFNILAGGLVYALFFLLCWYTFDGSKGKVLFVAILSDFGAGVLGTATYCAVNFLEDRSDILTTGGGFQLLDLLSPVLLYFAYKFVCKVIGEKRIWSIRNREWKYSGVSWFVIGIYVLLGMFTLQRYALHNLSAMIRGAIVLCIILFLITAGLGISIFRVYQRRVMRKNSFLKKQQELIILHRKNIQRQIAVMEQFHRQINEQMEQLLSGGCVKNEQFSERLTIYLKQLKEQYQFLETGLFCRDWLVDTVLSYMRECYRSHEVQSEYSFWNYDRKVIPSMEMAEFMFTVLDQLLKEKLRKPDAGGGKIVLKAEKLKNQILLFCAYDWKIRRNKLEKLIQPFVIMYDGDMEWKTGKDNTGFIIRVSGEYRK